MSRALLWFVVAAAISVTGCSTKTSAGEASTALATVAPIAKAPAPNMVDSVSPTGIAADGAQIRVRFKDDLVPVEALESPDKVEALSHFVIEPALPGRFIVLTPRLIGFSADAPLPHATRIRITLTAGLKNVKGQTLPADYAWTFETTPIALGDLPGKGSSDVNLEATGVRPRITVQSNVELDEASLEANAVLLDSSQPSPAPLHLTIVKDASPSPSPVAGEEAGAYGPEPGFTYALQPTYDLERGRTYAIQVNPGVAPLHGNLATTATYTGKLRTYGPLAYVNAAPDSGDSRFASPIPAFNFSNGLDAKSVAANVSIVPAPAASVKLAGASDGDAAIHLNPWALAPRTHYTVTFGGGLTDSFGQKLGGTTTRDFDTGDIAPDLWAPDGFNIFPVGPSVALNIETTNIPGNTYRDEYAVLKPTDLIESDITDSDARAALLPGPMKWQRENASPERNKSVDVGVPLASKLRAPTGLLAYGVRARWQSGTDGTGKPTFVEPQFTGAVQLTNVGVFAQWFPHSALVMASRLSDGSPIANATVEIYAVPSAGQTTKGAHLTCAFGRTGADGSWILADQQFARCASSAPSADQAPSLLAVVHDGADWSFVRTNAYSGAYSGDMYAGWSAGIPNSHGAIVSDRNLYQPGEPANFTAVAYFETDGVLARGRSARYDVSLRDPNGKQTSLGTRSLDEFGAFTIGTRLDSSAPLGYWTIQATGERGESLSGSFQVAQFRPPNFKVDLKLDKAFATGGDTVAASTTSTYLFGSPVAGGKSHYYVTRERTSFTPKGRDDFDFGRNWYGDEEPPSLSSDVVQKDVATAADGTSALSLTVPSDLPYAMNYRVDSQTTDVSNLSVADSKSFTALPSSELIGLRGSFLANTGDPVTVDVVVSEPDGRALAGRKVHLVLQRREYVEATQIVEGGETPKESVHYVDAGTADVTAGDDPQKVSFAAPSVPGSYRIRANFADAASDTTASDHQVWVLGNGAADWGASDDTSVAVKLNKETYRPGEIATALIQSPFPDADVYAAVIRHDVMWRHIETVHGSAPSVQFEVTRDMVPNAALQIVLVRRGAPLAAGVPAGLKGLSRVGFATFGTTIDDKYLSLTIKPNDQARPGGRQHIVVHLADHTGSAVSGEVTLAVVNEAVLQLTGYRFPDLVTTVWSQQPISTRWADNRVNVKLQTEQKYVDKGFGYGGGAMGGPASTRVRTQFKALAYFNGALRTDRNGDASVDFTLPDDLTTWRVLGMALSRDARFATSDATFVSTKPLVTNALLPQFARPGDRFSGGVSLTSTANSTGAARVEGKLGAGLTFVGASDPHAMQTDSVLKDQTQGFRFDMLAGPAGSGTVTFTSSLGGDSDAFSLPLPIVADDVTESVVNTGSTKSTATAQLNVDPAFPSNLGGLDVTLASSVLPAAFDATAFTKNTFDAPPFATQLASRLAVQADLIQYERHVGTPADAGPLASSLDLAQLRKLALPDGGYADWPGAKHSEIYSTAFVATQLPQLAAAGVNVTSDIARVRGYLSRFLADPGDEFCKNSPDFCAEARLEALETLATLGDRRTDHLADIYARQGKFGYYERVELARLLVKLPAWHAQGIALRDKLLQQLYETGRRAVLNEPVGGIETPTAGQAQLLGLLVDSHAPLDRIDETLRALLDLRTNGTWTAPSDSAEALNAILGFAFEYERDVPNFTAAFSLPQGPSVHATFKGRQHPVHEQSIPMASLQRGPATATFSKNGTGTLHYVLSLTYGLQGDQPGAYQGIRIDRQMRPAGDAKIFAEYGLAPPPQQTTVPVGAVYDIEDRITTDHPLDNVVITDPIPAGFEAVDTTFRTSTAYFAPLEQSWSIDYQQIYRDRVLSFAGHLDSGVYAVHYLVRTVTPGTYRWPAARVYMQYAPEEFGRTSAGTVNVEDAKP